MAPAHLPRWLQVCGALQGDPTRAAQCQTHAGVSRGSESPWSTGLVSPCESGDSAGWAVGAGGECNPTPPWSTCSKPPPQQKMHPLGPHPLPSPKALGWSLPLGAAPLSWEVLPRQETKGLLQEAQGFPLPAWVREETPRAPRFSASLCAEGRVTAPFAAAAVTGLGTHLQPPAGKAGRTGPGAAAVAVKGSPPSSRRAARRSHSLAPRTLPSQTPSSTRGRALLLSSLPVARGWGPASFPGRISGLAPSGSRTSPAPGLRSAHPFPLLPALRSGVSRGVPGGRPFVRSRALRQGGAHARRPRTGTPGSAGRARGRRLRHCCARGRSARTCGRARVSLAGAGGAGRAGGRAGRRPQSRRALSGAGAPRTARRTPLPAVTRARPGP